MSELIHLACMRCGDSQHVTADEETAMKMLHKCQRLTADQEVWMRAYQTVLGTLYGVHSAEEAVDSAANYADLTLAAFKERFDT